MAEESNNLQLFNERFPAPIPVHSDADTRLKRFLKSEKPERPLSRKRSNSCSDISDRAKKAPRPITDQDMQADTEAEISFSSPSYWSDILRIFRKWFAGHQLGIPRAELNLETISCGTCGSELVVDGLQPRRSSPSSAASSSSNPNEELPAQEDAVLLACGHVLGKDCILTWRESQDVDDRQFTCPYCRFELEPDLCDEHVFRPMIDISRFGEGDFALLLSNLQPCGPEQMRLSRDCPACLGVQAQQDDMWPGEAEQQQQEDEEDEEELPPVPVLITENGFIPVGNVNEASPAAWVLPAQAPSAPGAPPHRSQFYERVATGLGIDTYHFFGERVVTDAGVTWHLGEVSPAAQGGGPVTVYEMIPVGGNNFGLRVVEHVVFWGADGGVGGTAGGGFVVGEVSGDDEGDGDAEVVGGSGWGGSGGDAGGEAGGDDLGDGLDGERSWDSSLS